VTDAGPARLGRPLPGWRPPAPPRPPLEGRLARLDALDAQAHAAALHEAFAPDPAMWDHMAYGPFPDAAAFAAWIAARASGDDPRFVAVIDRATGRPAGFASWMRIVCEHGSIEIGHVAFAPALRRTAAATEALATMIGAAFDAGFRRVEWKCDALNAPSRRAAARLGLSFEGVFRNHMVVKGRNRDTAWFAATDDDWAALRPVIAAWLSPSNFDAEGRQRRRLSGMTAPLLRSSG
jgi:RimJ/RimL family protein N-acetyltransferase